MPYHGVTIAPTGRPSPGPRDSAVPCTDSDSDPMLGGIASVATVGDRFTAHPWPDDLIRPGACACRMRAPTHAPARSHALHRWIAARPPTNAVAQPPRLIVLGFQPVGEFAELQALALRPEVRADPAARPCSLEYRGVPQSALGGRMVLCAGVPVWWVRPGFRPPTALRGAHWAVQSQCAPPPR